MIVKWGKECGKRDLNPHAKRRHPLKMVRLPISPFPQEYYKNNQIAKNIKGNFNLN